MEALISAEAILFATISAAIAAVAIIPLLIAAYRDITQFTIPNELCVAVAVLGILRLITIGDLDAGLYAVAAATTVFMITLLLFARGYLGGGDAKLLIGTILLIGIHDLFPFFIVMSLVGALLSLIVLLKFKILTNQPARLVVPYGVAIASAAIVILVSQSSIIGWVIHA